jgi:UDP-N-acetyl-alpha-D-muramoyl-L-alanyl-L-glutamate epimerase
VPDLVTDTSRRAQVERLRRAYPVFRIDAARARPTSQAITLEFHFTAATHTFQPTVHLHGLNPGETARIHTPTARRLIRALAIIEAFSYWKAFCSPIIDVAVPPPDPAEQAWWQSFWPAAMGEFFYRNHIDFTTPGFLKITTAPGTPAETPPRSSAHTAASHAAGTPPLVMFSGGKDSLALTLAIRDVDTSPADFFVYNPTPAQRDLAGSLTNGGRILTVRREILPELLALNAANHPNGHTPYSAYLAVAALLAGYLRGSPLVLAGNSRSDDEPNIESYLGRPINHQWTKSHQFETALSEYRDRWLPGAPTYSSPLRPLFELQIIASLTHNIDAYLQTASCNRTKGNGWCLACAKCAWVFLATSAVFGHDLAVRKTGGDMFTNPALSDLYQRMAGLTGTKPFECTGTEEEVRSAIHAIGHQRSPRDLPALTTCLQHPDITTARPLTALLADWGHDNLVPPAIKTRIRKTINRPTAEHP